MLCYFRHFVTLAHHGLHFFFFIFFGFFWFSSLFTARQRETWPQNRGKIWVSSLGPFGGCSLPRLPSGESTLKCFSFAFLFVCLRKCKLKKKQWVTTTRLVDWPKSRTLTTPKYAGYHVEQQKFHSLLVGVQNGTGILEDSLTVFYKTKHIFTL